MGLMFRRRRPLMRVAGAAVLLEQLALLPAE
jgi:hypothetical protein